MDGDSRAAQEVVVTVHGIRTFGSWQTRLAALLRAQSPQLRIANYGYGYFSVLAFAIPFFRWIEVRRFRARLLALARAHPDATFSIVAHSFGTHLVAWALRGMPAKQLPRIRCLLLSGSVLKSDFDWSDLLTSQKVQTVVNDCGVDDHVLLLSQVFILFTGMAGRVGFHGFSDDRLVQRFFAGGHSHYFRPLDPDPDAFMARWWVPVLLGQEKPQSLDRRPPLNAVAGAAHALMRFADPLKLALYVGVGGIVVYHTAIVPREQLVLAESQRRYVEARSLLASELGVADAIGSFVAIAQDERTRGSDIGRRAALLARYGLQRLVNPQPRLDAIPQGSVFRWNGDAFLRSPGNRQLELDPRAVFPLPDFGATLLVSEDLRRDVRKTELRVVEVASGRQRLRITDDHDQHRLTDHIHVQRLSTHPQQLVVSFRISVIEDDPRVQTRRWAIDLHSGRNRELPADYDLSTQDCALGLFDTRVTHKTRAPAETASSASSSAACMQPVPASVIDTVTFPLVVPEASLYQRHPAAPPKAATDEGLCSPERPLGSRPVLLPLQVPARLSGAEALQRQLDDGLCVRVLPGAAGKQYVASLSTPGQWIGAWTVCEQRGASGAESCHTTSFPSEEQGGLIWHRPGSSWAGLRMGRTGTFSKAFLVVHLADGATLEPDISPRGSPLDLMVDAQRRLVLVAANVPGSERSVEVVVYRMGARQLIALGSRRFDSVSFPEGAEPAQRIDRVQLHAAGELVLLAMPGEAILGLQPLNALAAAGPQVRGAAPAGPLRVAWSLRSLGLGTRGTPRVWSSPDGETAVVSSSGSLRLLLLREGTLFTPAVHLAQAPWDCKEPIHSVVFDATGAIDVGAGSCHVRRRAPPPAVSQSEYARAATPLVTYRNR